MEHAFIDEHKIYVPESKVNLKSSVKQNSLIGKENNSFLKMNNPKEVKYSGSSFKVSEKDAKQLRAVLFKNLKK